LPEPATAVHADDAHAAVRTLVAGLPPRQRTVVFLRYYADLDEQAIAAALGIRRGTVAATLHQVHARVRASLLEASEVER
jgi:RNA polymerase sigma factor (sigma-70 family)